MYHNPFTPELCSEKYGNIIPFINTILGDIFDFEQFLLSDGTPSDSIQIFL